MQRVRVSAAISRLRAGWRLALAARRTGEIEAWAKVQGIAADRYAIYGADVRLPGMKFAVMARPPVLGGKLKSFDATETKKTPGVEEVYEIEGVRAQLTPIDAAEASLLGVPAGAQRFRGTTVLPLAASESNLLAAREMMAFTLAFHIVLACLGVALPATILVANYLGLKRGDRDALELAHRRVAPGGRLFIALYNDMGPESDRWRKLKKLYCNLPTPLRGPYAALTMLPYPSGDLHIGHWYAMTGPDIVARMHRMQGYNVMFPMGFDGFGLPAENAAIDRNIHPAKWTYSNIDNMRRQMRLMGASFDWAREVVTCEPEYYRWNQWFFLKFLEAGLAYRAKSEVDWCPNDGTLAREQVEGADRHCWRCGTPVVKRDLEQWFFRTTKYADEMLSYEGLIYPAPIKVMQTNWIGRSEGAEIAFKVAGRQADFHSLRHTLATMASQANVAPRVAMEMMRHSDMRLTMKIPAVTMVAA